YVSSNCSTTSCIYALSLHDALPIYRLRASHSELAAWGDRVLALLAPARRVREDGGAGRRGGGGRRGGREVRHPDRPGARVRPPEIGRAACRGGGQRSRLAGARESQM